MVNYIFPILFYVMLYGEQIHTSMFLQLIPCVFVQFEEIFEQKVIFREKFFNGEFHLPHV